MLLCSLSPSYMTFRNTIFYNRDILTVEEIYDYLLSKEKMHLVRGSASQAEDLVIRGRSQDKNLDRNIKARSESRHTEK